MIEADYDEWQSRSSPVLPDSMYELFLGLTNRVSIFYKNSYRTSRQEGSEIREFLSYWDSLQVVLASALNTFKEGNERFFVINLPFKILTDFIETSQELIVNDNTELTPYLDAAIYQLEQHVGSCSQVLERSKKDLITDNDLIPYSALKALSILIAYSKNSEVVDQALAGLKNALPEILTKLYMDDPDLRYVVPALQILKLSQEQNPEIHQSIINVLISGSGSQLMSLFTPTSLRSRKYIRELEPELNLCLQEQFKSWNLDSEVMIDQMMSPHQDIVRSERRFNFREIVIPKTLRIIAQIEAEEPQIASILQMQFGINNFYRYPPKMLIRQYRERDDNTKRYGLIWSPIIDEQDWVSSSMEAVEDLYDSIEDDYSVRFFEVKRKFGKQGLTRMLDSFDRIYNSGLTPRKIDFLIMIVHSFLNNPDIVHFGDEWNDNSYLSVRNLQNPRSKRINSYFDEDPDIILVSCKVDNHFRQIAQELFGKYFYASDQLVNKVSKFNVTKRLKGQRVRIVPEFDHVFTNREDYLNG